MCSLGTEYIELNLAVCKILAMRNRITIAALMFKLSKVPKSIK